MTDSFSSPPPSSEPPPGPVALLPVGRTVADAYRFTLQHVGQVLVAALLPFTLSLTMSLLGAGLGGALGFVATLVDVFAYAIFAVAWHRALLVGEPPRVLPQLGGRQLRFWLMSLLLVLIVTLLVGLPAMALSGLAAGGGGGPALGLIVIPLVLLAGYVAARFSFVFPAAAVDERFGLAESWRTTAGNAWRLIGAYLLALFPMIAVVFLLMVVGGSLLGLGGMMGGPGGMGPGGGAPGIGGPAGVVFIALMAVVNYIFAAVFVSLLSLAFRTCTGWVPDSGQAPPAAGPGPAPAPGHDAGDAAGDDAGDDARFR